MRRLTVGLLAAALGLAACAESATSSAPDFSSDPVASETEGVATEPAPDPLPTEPIAPVCSPQTAEVSDVDETVTFEGEAPTDLVVEELQAAEEGAPTPQPGDCVQVHYIGRLFDTGEVFDSSYPRGSTLSVTVGAGGVIPGFEQGVAETALGAISRVIIPPDLGYGASGAGPIPPNATLVFDIEVVAIQ